MNAYQEKIDGGVNVWPEGISCAVSLSFDDGKLNQIALAAPLLQKYSMHATFYLTTHWMTALSDPRRRRIIEQWRAMLAAGHEIGNHTVAHPCSTNFPFAVANPVRSPLESMSLAEMAEEIDQAQRMLETELEIKPATFAYPCGSTFVGQGMHCASYVPLVAERFIVGRSYNDECTAAPLRCDLARVPATRMDNRTLPELLQLVSDASRAGGWLILVAHSIVHTPSPFSVEISVLQSLLDHLATCKGNIWVDTVENVGRYVSSVQAAAKQS
jgi:peptidoglycan/xylan/chitin deacetylase (PgdA/CDA1 family)